MTVNLKRLDHVNLRTANLDAMVAWYGRILDMHPGPRPEFSFPGAWLYADGHPILHLVGVDTAPGADASELRLEHFAIAATGLKPMLAALKADGARHRINHIEDFGVLQVNLWDPDGNHIHIDFDPAEAEGLIYNITEIGPGGIFGIASNP
jgi:catechol 2,3-dioxygenase-like lactoylglutathione lyase family enzyme